MRKLDVIFQIEKIDSLKKICNELGIKDIIFSEINLYNPDMISVKRYRGAQYQVTQFTKIKAEFLIEEKIEDQIINELESLLEKDKGDSIIVYIVEQVR